MPKCRVAVLWTAANPGLDQIASTPETLSPKLLQIQQVTRVDLLQSDPGFVDAPFICKDVNQAYSLNCK